jgi:hypothetical protein
MTKRNNHFPPALKHGAVSATAIFPGEDRGAFKQLHDRIVAEFALAGPLEEDIGETMAHLVWRKQNLRTYAIAAKARDLQSSIFGKYGHCSQPFNWRPIDFVPDPRSPEQIVADREAANEEIKKQLGEALQLVELGSVVTINQLLEDLSVIDRLDGMIDRCIKRLLMVRGVKSLAPSSDTSQSRKRLSAA